MFLISYNTQEWIMLLNVLVVPHRLLLETRVLFKSFDTCKLSFILTYTFCKFYSEFAQEIYKVLEVRRHFARRNFGPIWTLHLIWEKINSHNSNLLAGMFCSIYLHVSDWFGLEVFFPTPARPTCEETCVTDEVFLLLELLQPRGVVRWLWVAFCYRLAATYITLTIHYRTYCNLWVSHS